MAFSQRDPESSSPSPSSGYRSPDSPQSSSSLPSSPTPVSPSKSPTGSHPKNVKIRLRENNSYEVVSTNSLTEEDQFENDKAETEELLDHGIDEDNDRGGDEASLEKFQKRQKMMEEQNRRRREILSKAIADRSRRTQSEAQKLKQIQSELAKLDTLLSTDVSILRDQIEVASLEFNEAQKRYDKAEKEFIDAKLQLFNKLEKKELLTEHLCRIIEANELRKANKLSELMAKLEMVDGVNEMTEDATEEVLPQLASLDEVTYAACTTLKDPKKNAAISANLAISSCDNNQESTKEKPKENVPEKQDRYTNDSATNGKSQDNQENGRLENKESVENPSANSLSAVLKTNGKSSGEGKVMENTENCSGEICKNDPKVS
ncbi:RAB6-interacting golgin-like [Macrobrachium nipponense]|uniref:RAB6-interacting golgin-like n=1 Tax=Macrobrachium nipponense TaxID=159736 RepID=UPI0030C8994E